MSNQKTDQPTDTAAATLAQQKVLEAQRKRAHRLLLKRRREKSHQ